MERLFQSIKIGINDKIYLKDPESSALGKKIVEQSILMIDEMGFEGFTFKKLGLHVAIRPVARSAEPASARDALLFWRSDQRHR